MPAPLEYHNGLGLPTKATKELATINQPPGASQRFHRSHREKPDASACRLMAGGNHISAASCRSRNFAQMPEPQMPEPHMPEPHMPELLRVHFLNHALLLELRILLGRDWCLGFLLPLFQFIEQPVADPWVLLGQVFGLANIVF